MRHSSQKILTLLLLTFAVGACDDDDTTDVEDTFDLTFQGDASYQTPHGGHAIAVALVSSDGTVLETMNGTVSATEDPAFSFTFEDAVTEGETYSVEYWIDSNFDGGTVGVCDLPDDDHQWRLAVGAVDDDVTVMADHDAEAVTDVCDSF